MKPEHSWVDGPLYLAIDQGGHASRALVFDRDGRLICAALREIHCTSSGDSRVEHDPAEMLDSLRAAISAVVADLGARRHALVRAGLATQRSNVVCWDRDSGEALSPVISWQDRRAHDWLDRIADERDDIRAITGLPLSPHYGANKLRWCLEELPAVRKAQRDGRLAWGPMASFLLFHLLRERPLLVDPVNAARTLLCDLAAADWSERMLDLFGLPREPLPAIVPCHHEFGALVVDDIAIPLTLCTGDQAAALFASGPPREDTLQITVGTGAFVLRSTGTRPQRSASLLSGIVDDDGRMRTHVLEGTVNGAGSALEWLQRQSAEITLPALAAWLAEDIDPPLFLNGVSGLGTPWMVAEAPVRFVGEGNLASRAVAVIESIVFLLQANLEALATAETRAVRIGGGLSRLDGLCQRLATLSGLRVERPASHEATAIGIARLLHSQSVGSGALTRLTGAELTTFTPQTDAALSLRYQHWRRALAQALTEQVRRQADQAPPPALPTVVAHRGHAGAFPENTWPAIEGALACGVRDIEFDVQLSADGVPMLFHDDRLKRTTGAGGRITALGAERLQTLSAGEPARFGMRFSATPIPTLADVIERIAAWPHARLFVEIKQESIDAFGIATVVERIVSTIMPRLSQCVLISFNAEALRIASSLGAPRIGWVLTRFNRHEIAIARALAPDFLFCNYRKLPRGRAALPRGPWRWVLYEITSPELAARLAARGVDYIETMHPDRFSGTDITGCRE